MKTKVDFWKHRNMFLASSFIIAVLLMFSANKANSQVLIGKNTGTPHPSSILDVDSDSLGILVPRIPFADRPTGVNGLFYYQTDNTPGFYYYGLSGWNRINFTSMDYWKPNGSDIYYNLGEVGIGTTLPTATLDVRGAPAILQLRSTAADKYALIYLNKGATTASTNAYIIYQTGGSIKWVAGTVKSDDYVISKDYGSSGGDGTFFISNTDRQVGINTVFPSAEFEVYRDNNQTNSQLWIEQGGLGDATLGFGLSGEKEYSMGIDNSDYDKFKISHDYDVGVGTAMTIDTLGRIAVNGNSPSGEFEVYRNDAASSSQLFLQQDGSGDATMGFWAGSKSYSLGIDNSDGNKLKIGNAYTAVDNSPIITMDGTSGRVGMGTEFPVARLHLENSIGTDQEYGLYINQNSSLTSGNHFGSYVHNNPATSGRSTSYYSYYFNTSSSNVIEGYTSYIYSGGSGDKYGF